MTKAATITGERETSWFARGGIIAAGRGLVLTGLALASLGLLLISLAGVFLVGLAFGVASHGSLPGLQRPALMAALVLGGLVLTRVLTVPVLLGIRRLARLTRELTGQWAGRPVADPYVPPPDRTGRRPSFGQQLRWLAGDLATWRDLAWTLLGALAGVVIAALSAVMIALGIRLTEQGLQRHPSASLLVASPKRVSNVGVIIYPPFHGARSPLEVVGGLALAAVGVAVTPWLLRGYAGLARTLLAPTTQAELAHRVYHLTQTRIETIDSGAAEIRRIERDLHDGAQARLVAVGMTLGAAEDLIGTRPDAARALLTEARASSALALAELRALVRGIHPPVLADRGLADAIRALALDSGLRVEVAADLPGRPPPPVESAAYFAVCELLANVSKHAGTRQAWIDLRHERGMLRVDVADDGSGGADPTGGTGLRGIERRVAAFDGILALNSPAGGPTVATMEIPCALSSPKTSSY